MHKEKIRCPDGVVRELSVYTLKELEAMSDSEFKKLCKNIWEKTRNFIRKGIEFLVRVIKALKYSITR